MRVPPCSRGDIHCSSAVVRRRWAGPAGAAADHVEARAKQSSQHGQRMAVAPLSSSMGRATISTGRKRAASGSAGDSGTWPVRGNVLNFVYLPGPRGCRYSSGETLAEHHGDGQCPHCEYPVLHAAAQPAEGIGAKAGPNTWASWLIAILPRVITLTASTFVAEPEGWFPLLPMQPQTPRHKGYAWRAKPRR